MVQSPSEAYEHLKNMISNLGMYCQAQLRIQLQLQFEADLALFSFYPTPTHHPPIRTSSDLNSNFSLKLT